MRRFYFVRQTDVSGTSGTGAVCEAVLLSDGRVILRWLTYLSSIAIYNSLEDAIAIHGHDGQTDVIWVDEEPSTPPVDTERPPGWSDKVLITPLNWPVSVIKEGIGTSLK